MRVTSRLRGLDVAVDQSLLEGVVKTEGRLADVFAGLGEREWSPVAHDSGQVGPIDQLHFVVMGVSDLVRVEHLHHVGVPHLGEGGDFLKEAGFGGRMLDLLLADDLDRHVFIEARVMGLEDAAHAPFAEQLVEDVRAEREVAAAALEDFLDLERGEPAAPAEFLGDALHIRLGRAHPRPQLLELAGLQQAAGPEVGVEGGRRFGGAAHRGITGDGRTWPRGEENTGYLFCSEFVGLPRG